MIAFGSSVTDPAVYGRCAEVGIKRAAESDSEVRAMPSVGSIFRSYNALLERFADCEDLEALVLVHQDAEIVEPDFCSIIRRELADPDVGIVGCVGAIGVRSIAWWEASVTCASFINRYDEHGGGDLPSFSWAWNDAPAYARVGEVDARRVHARARPVGGPERPLRRAARQVPRLRPRLLPCRSATRASGHDRRLPRDPLPAGRRWSRTPRTGSTRTSSWRQVGRADGDRRRRRQLARAGAARRGSRRCRAPQGPHERVRDGGPGARAAACAGGHHRQRLVADHRSAAAATKQPPHAPAQVARRSALEPTQ